MTAPGDLFCDYGHLEFREGDYIMLPRGTMWRIEATAPVTALLIEATNDSFRLPEKGLVGKHAIFDPGMLDVPAIDDAFEAQKGEVETRVRIKRGGKLTTRHLSVQPARCGGLAGRPVPGARQLARPAAPDEPPPAPAAVGAHDIRRRPLRGLHLRAAPGRERSRRAQTAVLPQQRRLRRDHFLSPRQVHVARQHPSRHGDACIRAASRTGRIRRRSRSPASRRAATSSTRWR